MPTPHPGTTRVDATLGGELRANLEMASRGLVLICKSKFFRPLQFQMTEDSVG